MRLAAVVFLFLGLALSAAAGERSSLLPDVPVATGDPHPEGNEFWRKNHMELMKHDRDLTMYDGNRDVGASIGQCFECHAATDEAGEVVTYASEKHFCRVCHDYVAVKVDCFSCHRSTPPGFDEGMSHAGLPTGPDVNATLAYLSGLGLSGGVATAATTEETQ